MLYEERVRYGTYAMDIARSSNLGTLRFLTGPLAGTTYPINKPVITLGRDQNNDLAVPDPTVSRQHAQLLWNNGSWTIKKLNNQNTLTVNSRDVTQSPLTDNDTIGLGRDTTFAIQGSAAPQASGVYQSGVTPFPQGPQYQAGNVPVQAPPSQSGFPGPVNTPQQPIALPVQPSYMGSAESSTQASYHGNTGGSSGGPVHTMRMGSGSMGSAGSSGVPSIEVTTNTDAEKQAYPLLPNQQTYNIGRDPSNTIVINRPTVSGFHFQIVREGSNLVLVHPHPQRGKTVNGVSYRGRQILGHEQLRHVMQRGDVFRISDANGTFVSLTYNDGSGQIQEALPEIRPIPLGAPVITIGRSSDNMVVLKSPQVSNYHARLERVGDRYRLVDLRSTNHVFVNAHRVTSHDLTPGDEIRIGSFKLTYTGTELTQYDESDSIRIDALHLIRRGNRNVVLLNDISLAIPPRKFVALVGGSGAGKSTLLDSLNGFRPSQEGVVLYNGQDYYSQLEAYSTQLGYVPQDDIIHRDLSVERALYYAAKLRLPKDFTEEQINERIDEVLDDVEMTHRRALLINQLSGGQRKRVSIGLELLAKPSVFFLDEPTSGLDPGLDRKMMMLLRRLADKGHTIVLVTHATNNINTCDYVCFLAQGGHLAYYGSPDDAKAYFGKTDFAEIYSALEPTEETPNIAKEAEARFKQSQDYVRYVVEPLQQGPAGNAQSSALRTRVKPPARGNPWKQFFLLSRRYLELILNDRVNLWILLLQAPVIGLILFGMIADSTFKESSIVTCFAPAGFAQGDLSGDPVQTDCQQIVTMLRTTEGQQFAASQQLTPDQLLDSTIGIGSGGDAQKILFIMAFAAVMFGCINGSREIVKENAIYRRERSVNLGITPYIMSKFVVLGIFSLVQSIILVLLVYLRDPQIALLPGVFLPPMVEIYITMALTAIAGLMTGLLISAIVPNNDRAMSLVPLPLIPQVIFAGVVFNLDNPAFLQIPGALFSVRWAMAAMGSSIGLHGDKLNADSFSYEGLLFTQVTIDQFARTQALLHLLLCWLALLLLIVVQGLGIAWFLKRKDIRK